MFQRLHLSVFQYAGLSNASEGSVWHERWSMSHQIGGVENIGDTEIPDTLIIPTNEFLNYPLGAVLTNPVR